MTPHADMNKNERKDTCKPRANEGNYGRWCCKSNKEKNTKEKRTIVHENTGNHDTNGARKTCAKAKGEQTKIIFFLSKMTYIFAESQTSNTKQA